MANISNIMKQSLLAAAIISFSLLLAGCADQEHFISSSSFRKEVKNDLNNKITALEENFDVNDIYSECKNNTEKEAMEFLYAYMPLGDMIDYEPSLYLNGIRGALRAREEMPWGETLPETVFRHFVLPLRVNNETLDESRDYFYEELRDRVREKTMYDAALEVNHWCHEKVIYTPSDARTSSPMATMITAHGRCGEESVFTVAALRSVGIPARQVYTPRWAHTDDNHAWVEVWVDGEWHYLGACEPEPKLDIAWFSSTAKRALLMHTKVFGKYRGKEDIISTTNCFTEINVTANYTPTNRIQIAVKDENGKAVENAKVEFKIYNYAEFYSAITSYTDKKGKTSATFGKGDIMVWASSGDKFGFTEISVAEARNNQIFNIVLDKKTGDIISQEIDVVPPAEEKVITTVTDEEKTYNDWRLAQEDAIREKYIATFASAETASKLCKEMKITSKSEQERILKYLTAARGNWKQIYNYLLSLSPTELEIGLRLLDLVSAKDLRDTPATILLDHLANFNIKQLKSASPKEGSYDDILIKYVLNPRIANELLQPWRGVLQSVASDGILNEPTPENVIAFTEKIKILDEYNPQRIPISPIGTLSLMAANTASREIFFVALCRSLNIPARIEEVSGKLQYHSGNSWHDVSFVEREQEGAPKIGSAETGTLTLTYAGQKFIDDPKFETHFTIAKIEGGGLNTLNFRDKEGYEGTMSWKGISKTPIPLDCGYYLLTTGTRMASGKVLSTIKFFNIEKDNNTTVELVMREDPSELQVIGNMDAESKFLRIFPDATLSQNSILETTGRGFFVLGFLLPNHEPSNHAIRSLFEQAPKKPTILFYRTEEDYLKFKSATTMGTPDGITFGIDIDNAIFNAITKEMKLTHPELPLFVIADTFGKIVYICEGYNIGTAEQLNR